MILLPLCSDHIAGDSIVPDAQPISGREKARHEHNKFAIIILILFRSRLTLPIWQ